MVSERKEVIRRELEWHEQEAFRRSRLDALLYAAPAFDAVVDAGLSFLQLQSADLILELGCGEGKEALQLSQQGCRVICVDLAQGQLLKVRQQFALYAPNAQVYYVQANAEALPFITGAFRLMYGKAILHHLDTQQAVVEVKRTLQMGGRATFAEPLAHHPLFWLARRLTPAWRTLDERPFSWANLRTFSKTFAQWHMSEAFLLAPLAYPLRLWRGGEAGFRYLHQWLQWLDRQIFKFVPPLRKLAWYGIINVQHKSAVDRTSY